MAWPHIRTYYYHPLAWLALSYYNINNDATLVTFLLKLKVGDLWVGVCVQTLMLDHPPVRLLAIAYPVRVYNLHSCYSYFHNGNRSYSRQCYHTAKDI